MLVADDMRDLRVCFVETTLQTSGHSTGCPVSESAENRAYPPAPYMLLP